MLSYYLHISYRSCSWTSAIHSCFSVVFKNWLRNCDFIWTFIYLSVSSAKHGCSTDSTMPMWAALRMLTLKYHNQRRVCWANLMVLVVFKSPIYHFGYCQSFFLPLYLSPYPQMKMMQLFHAPWWHEVFDYQVWRGHPLLGDSINISLSSASDIELSLSLWCCYCYRNWILDWEVSEPKYLYFLHHVLSQLYPWRII